MIKKIIILLIIWIISFFVVFNISDWAISGNDWDFIYETDAYCEEKHGDDYTKASGCRDLRHLKETKKRENIVGWMQFLVLVVYPIATFTYFYKTKKKINN
jgi:hypothetical protein